MFNNGKIWVRPGLPQTATANIHRAFFNRPSAGIPVGGTLPNLRQMSSGGNCGNCGGAGRVIYVDPNDGQYKDIPCGACSGSGQSSL